MSTRTSIVTGVDFVSIPTRTSLPRRSSTRTCSAWSARARGNAWEEPLGIEFETGTVTIALIAPEQVGIPFQPHKVPIALHVDDVAVARGASSPAA